MEVLTKILTTMLLSKFGNTPAGSKIMQGVNSAKTSESLWQKFTPQTTGA